MDPHSPCNAIFMIFASFFSYYKYRGVGGWKLQCMGVVDPAALCVGGSGMPRNIDGFTFPMQYYILIFVLFVYYKCGAVGGVETSVGGCGGSWVR